MREPDWQPDAEVRCEHVAECGACPLMPLGFDGQRVTKLRRLAESVGRYRLPLATPVAELARPVGLAGYRRRAKLVVGRTSNGKGAIGLYRRNDSQVVIDIPGCQVLDPGLLGLVAQLRELVDAPPSELAPLLTAHGVGGDGNGVLVGIDVRALVGPPSVDGACPPPKVLMALTLAAERAAPLDQLREAARALRERLPSVAGVAVQLRHAVRPAGPSPELVPLSGATELADVVDVRESPEVGESEPVFQLVSHGAFLHVHRGQASRLYRTVVDLVGQASAPGQGRVLDLYGGTGAIALALARAGHFTTLVESNPAAVALASRAAQVQRLPVEAVAGEVASVTRALATAGAPFGVVVVNPPRRGLSPAAREAIAALGARRIVYVACEVDNLSRDLDHLARLGYEAKALHPMDMLPLTEEVEVVAVLERAPPVPAEVLFAADGLVAFAKPPHEPIFPQPEYPSSLVGRAGDVIGDAAWEVVLAVDPGESGVVLLARDPRTADRWRRSIDRSGRLVSLTAARGVTPAKGAIARELQHDGRVVLARTRYRRLAIGGGHSMLRVVPERPVMHQVRRHLAAIGHPVLGDMRYGHAPTNRYFEEKHGLDRSFVHLVRVEVDHPETGERLLVEAPLSPDLRSALLRASDPSVLAFLEQKSALGVAGGRYESRDEEPPSERVSGGGFDQGPDGLAPPAPPSLRGRNPLAIDEAPRTIRGELVSGDELDEPPEG